MIMQAITPFVPKVYLVLVILLCLVLSPALSVSKANAAPPVRVQITEIGPEVGFASRGSGFLFDRQGPGQIVLGSPSKVFRTRANQINWSPLDLVNLFGARLGSFFIRQDPDDPRTICATYNSLPGVSISHDFGTTWVPGQGINARPRDCAISEASSNIVFVISNDALQPPFEHLWKSTDGGATFTPETDIGLPTTIYDEDAEEYTAVPTFSSMATTPANANTVYVVQDGDMFNYYPPSIYKSTNGGQTFSRLNGAPSHPLQVFPHPTLPNVLYAQNSSASASMYRSTNGGTTFQPLNGGLPANKRNYFVAFDPRNPTHVYVAGEGGLFKSTNSGTSFQKLGLTAAQLGVGAMVATVDPVNSNIIYVNTNRGNFKSVNGGSTFLPINKNWRAAEVRHIAFDDDAQPRLYLAMGSSNGIMRTLNRGRSFEDVSRPNSLANPTYLAISPNNSNVIFAGTRDRLFRTLNGGNTWSQSNVDVGSVPFSASGSEIGFDLQDPGNVYFATNSISFLSASGGFYKSTNGGASFEQTYVNDDPYEHNPSDLAIHPFNPSVIFTAHQINGSDAPLKSTDAGYSFTPGPIFSAGINDIEIDPASPNIVYLGGVIQFIEDPPDQNSLVRSTDGGATFTAADTGLSGAFIDMVIDPETPSRLYVWTSQGLYISEDRGTTWALLENDKTVKAFDILGDNTLTINPKTPNFLYLDGHVLLEIEIR